MLNANNLNIFLFIWYLISSGNLQSEPVLSDQTGKYSSQITVCLGGEKALIVTVGSHNKYFCSEFELINLSLFSVKCKIRSAPILLIYTVSFNLSLVLLSSKAFSAEDTSST